VNLAFGSVVVAVAKMVLGCSEAELGDLKVILDGLVAVEEDSMVRLGDLLAELGVLAAELGDLLVVLGVLAAGLVGLAAELQSLVSVLWAVAEALEGSGLDLKAYWSYKDCGTLAWEPADLQDHAVGQRL
jgi:hypothetical protein